ncbi:acyltransferase [Methylobacter psychrophilus]|uniref:acyltransferase n=1 Tax=Methylobacter psychrophilus TaxID=96941 RepID=UPI0021D49752|nr:acyltransferase [Methylobacter psychrophilus]
MKSSYYSNAELVEIGFHKIGRNVLISRKASIYFSENISIGDNVRIDDYCVLSASKSITLGNHIHIGCYSALFGGSGITFHDFCNVSSRVTILTESDDGSGESMVGSTIPKKFKPNYKAGNVVLERHSCVAINSTIMPGVILSEGSAVGAHSLVTKNCEPWTIYFGVPAKKLHSRKKTIIELEKNFINEWGR